ncbi:MAG: hypothetical protein JNL32_03220 [Candidatus Kapabacteria bacterium]|nr:hypothetical protein [Candidatus Kapabacteria bacterium]
MAFTFSTKRILGNAGASVAQSVVATVALFWLYRSLLTTLGAEQMGVWSIIFAAVTAGKLAELGIGNGVVKFVSAAAHDTVEAQNIIRTALSITSFSMCFVLGVMYMISPYILPAIVGQEHTALASSLLPFALYSFLTATIAGVYQSAMDALLITKHRAVISIITTILYAGLAVVLTEKYGLFGLGIAQCVQNTVQTIASYLVVSNATKTTIHNPFGWSAPLAKKLLTYGLNAQLAAVSIALLCEPVTKLYLHWFGGLQSVTYFDMATRIITQFRSVILSAFQAVVPVIARLHESDHRQQEPLYSIAMNIIIPVSISGFVCIASLSPIVSRLWIGSYQEQFTLTMVVLSVGWFVNTVAVPSYMMNLGSGALGYNTISHFIIGILNAAAGYVLGIFYGFEGVLWGWSAGLISGSIYLIFTYHKRYQTHHTHKKIVLFILFVVQCVAGIALYGAIRPLASVSLDISVALAASLVAGIVCFIAIWYGIARRGTSNDDGSHTIRQGSMFHHSSHSYL